MSILLVKDPIQKGYFKEKKKLLCSFSYFVFLIRNYFVTITEVYTVEIMLRGRNREAKFLI